MRLFLVAFAVVVAASPIGAQQSDQKDRTTKKLSVSIVANDPLNMYFEEDLATPEKAVTLAVTATNQSTGPLDIVYRWQLFDHRGKELRSYRFTRKNLPAGESDKWYVNFHLDPDLKGKGYFRYRLRTAAGGEDSEWETAFVVLPKPAAGARENSLFGIAASPDDKAFEAMRRMGAKWLRTDSGCNWYGCEPSEKGKFQWESFDKLVAQCKAHDLMLLPVLDYAPEWAKPKDPSGKPYQYLDAPEKVEDYADFVAAVVSRYGKDVKYYELWNEPYVMGWTWHNSAQHYRDLLKATHPAAKKANPDCVLIASAGSASHLQDVVFAKGASAGEYLDETSTHTYGAGRPEDDFLGKAEHSVLVSRRNGKNVVWCTEHGWQLWDNPDLTRYVPRAYALAKMVGIRTLMWFTLASDDMGLFKPGYIPRAAVASYAVCASMLEDTVLVEDLYPYSRKLWGALFKRPDGRKVAVVWSTAGRGTLRMRADRGVQAYDIMGNPAGKVAKNVLEAPISDEVLYLVSDGDQAVFLGNLKAAEISGIDPVSVRVKPLLGAVSQGPPIRVEVTNEIGAPVTGEIMVKPPKGWILAKNRERFGPINPGQTTVVSFPVTQAAVSPDNRYHVTVYAAKRLTNLPWQMGWNLKVEQDISAAIAVRGTPTIDGKLDDWENAVPLTLSGPEFLSPWAPEGYRKSWTVGNLSAVVYTMWDDQYFYFAAKVTDNFHSQISSRENPYHLPHDGDSIQIAFGVDAHDPSKLKSPDDPGYRRGLIFDTDYEYCLSLTPRGPEVFRLHTPETGYQTFYPSNPDIGLGVIDSVSLAVARDDVKEVTTYEAAVPWSELRLVDRTKPVRFSFIINDRDRGNAKEGWLEWAAGSGVTKGNELSFSPSWTFTTANLTEWAFVDAAR
ncbi:MAG: hypothetical protein ACUVTZ_05585 [Armatimonadota bacterium]